MKAPNRLKAAATKSFYYGAGAILGKIVGLIMLPIYTRYLSPEDYGVASLLIFYVSLIQLLFGAQLEQGTTYFAHNSDFKLGKLWLNSVTLSIAATAIPVALSLYFSDQISNVIFKTESYGLAVKIISATILLQMVETYGFQYTRIADFYKSYLCFTVLKLVSQLTANIILVVKFDMGIIGVAYSTVIGTFVAAALTSIHPIIYSYKEKISKQLLVDMVKYCYPLWLTGFVGLYVSSVPQFALSRFSTLSDLGLFNLANSFGILVGVLFWNPFFSYWQVERFKIYNEPNAEKTYNEMLYSALIISLVIVIGISLLAKPVIQLMADPAFFNAYIAVLPLCLFIVFRYLTWFFNFSFLVTKNTQENFKNNIFNAIVTTVISLILIPTYGFAGAAWALAISGAGTTIYCYVRSRKYYDMKISLPYIILSISITIALITLSNTMIPVDVSFIKETVIRVLICIITGLITLAFVFNFVKKYQSPKHQSRDSI